MYVMKKLGIRNISIAVQCPDTYELKSCLTFNTVLRNVKEQMMNWNMGFWS